MLKECDVASKKKWSYCYHPDVDYFPITTCPEVVYSSYTLQRFANATHLIIKEKVIHAVYPF